MNSERPDHDDAGPEDVAAENAGTTRDADTGTTPDADAGASRDADGGSAPDADGAPGLEADGGSTPDADDATGPVADEPADKREAAENSPEAAGPAPEREQAPAGGDPGAEVTPAPGIDASGTEESRAEESGTDQSRAHASPTDGLGPSDGDVRPLRRPSLVAASVAAAVLLVGGGGAYLAATASGSSDGRTTTGADGDDTPPPLVLDGYSGGDGRNGIAPGEPNPYGVTYRADGPLPAGPGSAPVYRTGGSVTEDQVTELAKALGVEGKPVLRGQSWTVGTKDGSGPELQVTRQAPGTWSFHRYAQGTDACRSETVCASDPVAPSVDPVSETVAKKAAAPVLKAVGQDDAKLDAKQLMGAQRIVNADPVVGSLPTHGWTTGVTVSAQGEVVGGSGRLRAPVKGDTYPVLSAEKTLGLMNAAPGSDHRMGIGGCATPVPLKDRQEAPCGESTASPQVQKNTIVVEKAVFGLASHLVDGRQALVPSWLFEVRESGGQSTFEVTHPAVDPQYLASSTPSAQPTAPSAPPSAPGDEPTSAPATRDVQVEGYTAEGTELTVSFTGGVCADYEVTASESAGKVTVTVTETPWPDKVCIMIAKVYHRTVPLDEPLGGREVVGTDGKGVPLEKAGARLPETSGAR
ncbi:hypothetical protein [Streptomyces resistomycificus]|uniref:Membrane protein n=1 Tax=Streptomyces resistomycificus TaxID=67356 RepID=A0A0L8LM01_9ACTN|nr:hypothetical protein [Streptomyces resistomycificus]KOG39147.1 membrane protein [Streptomyces resistomycificus]KUN99747.1 hypothetical protein AQJ84_09995 [Streptomyces resistomycificus]